MSPIFGDASSGAPNTHNSFVFESNLNFKKKFIPEMHLRKISGNAFPDTAKNLLKYSVVFDVGYCEEFLGHL